MRCETETLEQHRQKRGKQEACPAASIRQIDRILLLSVGLFVGSL